MNEAEYLSWRDSRIRSYDQYLLVDPAASAPAFDTGLEDAEWDPRTGDLAAYRMPLWMPVTSASHGTPLEVWGCARPAPYVQHVTHRVQQVEIQFAPRRRVGLQDAADGQARNEPRGCYFDVACGRPPAATIRLRWRGAGGHTSSAVLQAICCIEGAGDRRRRNFDCPYGFDHPVAGPAPAGRSASLPSGFGRSPTTTHHTYGPS